MVRLMIGGVSALAVAMGIGRFAFTPILPAMQLDVGFGSQLAGIVASANFLGYFIGAFAAAAVPGGRARTAVFRSSLVAGLATTGLMAASDAVWLWIALRFVSGLASAGILVLLTGMVLDRLARDGRPQLSGVLFGGVGLGIAISGLAVLVIDPWAGWRGSWLGLSVLSVVLLVPAWLWLEDRDELRSTAATADHGAALAFPLFLLILAYFCEGVGYIVSGTFLVSIVQALPGLSAYGELAWILVGLAGVPSCLLWAMVAHRCGLVGTLVAAHVVQAVGIALPLVSASAASVLVAALLFGGTFMGITTLTLSLAGRIAPANRGRAVGQVTAAFGLGQIIGPLAAGVVAERTGSFDLALAASAGVVAFGGVLLLLGPAWAAVARPQPQPAKD